MPTFFAYQSCGDLGHGRAIFVRPVPDIFLNLICSHMNTHAIDAGYRESVEDKTATILPGFKEKVYA